MRDFFKKEVLARTYEIFGVNQLEKMEDDQITFLLDALDNVSQLYDYIPQAEQKKIINKRLLTDRDFRNINARLIAGWFEMDGKIFFTQKHHKEEAVDLVKAYTKYISFWNDRRDLDPKGERMLMACENLNRVKVGQAPIDDTEAIKIMGGIYQEQIKNTFLATIDSPKGNGARMREHLDGAGVKFDPEKHKEETIVPKESSSLDDFLNKTGDYAEPLEGSNTAE